MPEVTRSKQKVLVYTTPTCVFCKMAKAFFKENGVAYEEKDALADVGAREELMRKSGQMGVPVIDVDGSIVVGFDEPQLRKLLGLGA